MSDNHMATEHASDQRLGNVETPRNISGYGGWALNRSVIDSLKE